MHSVRWLTHEHTQHTHIRPSARLVGRSIAGKVLDTYRSLERNSSLLRVRNNVDPTSIAELKQTREFELL